MSASIKNTLRNSRLITTCFQNTRSWFTALLYDISPVLLAKYRFKARTGRRLNLENPQSFDEKLLWLMLYWKNPLKTRCADKYTMRSYVEEHGLGHLLPELLGIYENSTEIDFDELPERFVLKCTHGWGTNVICRSKAELNLEETKRKLDAWIKTDWSKVAGEIHYGLIKPRIICEGYLDDLANDVPCDYKVYCFDGKAHCTMACTERGLDRHAKFDFYDREWKNKLPYSKSSLHTDRNITKPKAYEEMIDAAELLSKPFPFVRMDFYNINGKAVIGEMTFTPAGCIDTGYTELAQHILGEMIKLPEKLLE